jgi:hypothetical protein
VYRSIFYVFSNSFQISLISLKHKSLIATVVNMGFFMGWILVLSDLLSTMRLREASRSLTFFLFVDRGTTMIPWGGRRKNVVPPQTRLREGHHIHASSHLSSDDKKGMEEPEKGEEENIGVRRGVFKRVEDGHRPPTLQEWPASRTWKCWAWQAWVKF